MYVSLKENGNIVIHFSSFKKLSYLEIFGPNRIANPNPRPRRILGFVFGSIQY